MGAEKKNDETTQELDPEMLNKSWNSVMGELKKSLGMDDQGTEGMPEDGAAKAKEFAKAKSEKVKKEKPAEEEDTEETPEDEEGTETSSAPMRKSLADEVAENNSEAEITMDIEPFLKSFVESVDKVLTSQSDQIKSLQKDIKGITSLVKSMGKATVISAEMQKSVKTSVDQLGTVKIPSMSRLRKSGDRFDVGQGEQMTPYEVMQKATELCQQGQISAVDVTKLEGRMNHGAGIPDELKHFFVKKA